MKPSLVILAAGMGRRFGGLKQLEPVGPDGATIMDYSVYDALRAGFGEVVFVIRPDMEMLFRRQIGSRYERHVPVRYAMQRLDALPEGFDVPAGRTKPWGTGQAVLAAGGLVEGPLAVVNADDFYGAGSFAALGAFLREAGENESALVTWALRDTFSQAGSVNRGVCRCSPEGWLEGIEEVVGIERAGADGRCVDEQGQTRIIDGGTRVSMNMWGFGPVMFELLEEEFARFLERNEGSSKAEFYLPVAVQAAIDAGRLRVKALPSGDVWCGVTNREDLARVVETIAGLVAGGVPAKAVGLMTDQALRALAFSDGVTDHVLWNSFSDGVTGLADRFGGGATVRRRRLCGELAGRGQTGSE